MTRYTSRYTSRCALCNATVRDDFLMCPQHWRLVPRAQQQTVYRTWGRLQRLRGVGAALSRKVTGEYLAARQAAIESAQGAVAPTTTTGDQP